MGIYNLTKNSFNYFIIFYIILISFLSLNVGITHDEVHNLEVWKIKSKIYSNFLFNTDYEVVFPDAGMQYYGIGFHIFSYPFELFFRNILVFFDYSDDAILLISKHPSIVIIFAISGVFFRNIIFLITKNKFYSNITAVFYLVYPYILGHSFFNFKDIPFMSLWVICTYLFMVISKKLYNKEKIYFLELSTFAFLTAFLLSVRVSGILILVEYFIFIIFVIHFSKIEIINFIKSISNKLLIFLSIFAMSFYLLHPSFWSDPSSLLEAFKYMSKHIQTVCTITFGTCMKAQNLPSSYIPLWLLIKLPILTLLSFLLFPIVEKKIFSKNLNTIFIGPLILTPFLIVLLLIIFNVNLYDELRQILFIVPLILLASFSVLFFFSKKISQYLIIFYIFFFSIQNIQIFPYNYLWLNNFSFFTKVSNNFELDYWGSSTKNLSYYFKYNLHNKDECIISNRNHGIKTLLNKENVCFINFRDLHKKNNRPFYIALTERALKKGIPNNCENIFNEYFTMNFSREKIVVAKIYRCT
tara:strand:+ start:341 stop:1918 length:1578 start_codon:yes stop_codon:yes gene_type:complete